MTRWSAVPSSSSMSSWLRDSPGTRGLVFSHLLFVTEQKLRRRRGVFMACTFLCWGTLDFVDSHKWILASMLDPLAVEKSTRVSHRRSPLSVYLAYYVTRTSIKCEVAPLLWILQTGRNACPSSQSPPMLVRMKARQKLSCSNRPAESFRGHVFAMSCWAFS